MSRRKQQHATKATCGYLLNASDPDAVCGKPCISGSTFCVGHSSPRQKASAIINPFEHSSAHQQKSGLCKKCKIYDLYKGEYCHVCVCPYEECTKAKVDGISCALHLCVICHKHRAENGSTACITDRCRFCNNPVQCEGSSYCKDHVCQNCGKAKKLPTDKSLEKSTDKYCKDCVCSHHKCEELGTIIIFSYGATHVCVNHVCANCNEREKFGDHLYCYNCKCKSANCPNVGTIKTKSGNVCPDHLCTRCSSNCAVSAGLCGNCKCSIDGCNNPARENAKACSNHLCDNCHKHSQLLGISIDLPSDCSHNPDKLSSDCRSCKLVVDTQKKRCVYCEHCVCLHNECTELGTHESSRHGKFCKRHWCTNCETSGIFEGHSRICIGCKCRTKRCGNIRDKGYQNCSQHRCSCGCGGYSDINGSPSFCMHKRK